jgi:hypothetical protein
LQLPQSQKIRKTALRSCRISSPANGRSTKAHHDKPLTQRSPLWGGVGGGGRTWRTQFAPQLRPPSPALPHKGRAIAYGFALVVFARIEGKPSRCRHTATESNPEQNRIQCGTTELPLRSDPSRKVKYGRNFSICDSPAPQGGREQTAVAARNRFHFNGPRLANVLESKRNSAKARCRGGMTGEIRDA